MEHSKQLFSTDEAAEFLGVCPRTLIRWRNERVGPPFTRVGKQYRYRRSSIEEWLARNETVPVRDKVVA